MGLAVHIVSGFLFECIYVAQAVLSVVSTFADFMLLECERLNSRNHCAYIPNTYVALSGFDGCDLSNS